MQDIDNGYKKIKEELEKLDKLKLIIYIDDKATYPGGIKVDFIAMLMEYGSDDFDVPFQLVHFFVQLLMHNMMIFQILWKDV